MYARNSLSVSIKKLVLSLKPNHLHKCVTFAYAVFLSGFGPRGGKTAICNLVGGHGSLNMQICQFQGGARVSLGGANAPPRPPLKETLIRTLKRNGIHEMINKKHDH